MAPDTGPRKILVAVDFGKTQHMHVAEDCDRHKLTTISIGTTYSGVAWADTRRKVCGKSESLKGVISGWLTHR